MSKKTVAYAIGGLLALATVPALAAGSNFNASATIAAPIAVTTVTQLSFGSLAAGSTPGTAVIAPAGSRTLSGGVTGLAGATTAASFSVTGAASTPYTISLPASGTIATGGGSTMAVSFATADLTGGLTARTLPATGPDTFSLGGTLSVGANQVAGEYTGTFTITVDY